MVISDERGAPSRLWGHQSFPGCTLLDCFAQVTGVVPGNNRSCHGQADAHSTPLRLPRDCWTSRCPPVTERLEREAIEEGPMRRPLQACTAHHGSARPYAGAKDGGVLQR